MSLTVRQIRDRISTGLRNALESQGWRESRYPAELLGMDSRDIRHLAFAVGLPSTTPADGERQSTRNGATTKGAIVASRVLVRWGYRLRADGEAADYSAMLDAEAVLVAAVLAIDKDPQLGLRLLDLERRADGDLVDATATFECMHRLPLA